MRNLPLLFAALLGSALLTSCAADAGSTIAERDQKQVTTGSNIPKRDKGDVKVVSREELERADLEARGGAQGMRMDTPMPRQR